MYVFVICNFLSSLIVVDLHNSKNVRGNVELAMHLDHLDNMSKENGFPADKLTSLVTLIEKDKFSK